MGGGYSDLNIYFKSIKDEYSGNGYKVTPKQENFVGCSDFQEISHTINITNTAKTLYYNVLLYEGSNESYTGEYVYGYYYPNNDNEVIETVRIYYSVLAPDNPLIISFYTKGNQKYHCLPSELKQARWNYASNITEYTCSRDLTKELLNKEFQKISLNRKICFKIGKQSSDVSCFRQMLDNEYYRCIYRPIGKESILGCDDLFSLDTVSQQKPKDTNKLNHYYLSQLDGKLYDGIMVYYEHKNLSETYYGKEKALLLEFVESSKVKVQVKKKDNEGNWWMEEPVDYNGDTKLKAQLKLIKEQATKEKVFTVILDKKDTNGRDDNFMKEEKHNAYNKYSHTFNNEEKPIFLFQRQVKTFENSETIKTKKVDVFYLKTKGGDDIEPFLIIIEENGQVQQKKQKAYHFANKYKFQDWKLCPEDIKLDERLPKIDSYASCIPVIGLLRWYAYQILTGKDPSEKEIKEEETAQRPKVTIPTTDEPLPINWIIGGSVGGGVFVISSAALYGVYWYNTTIKLLT